MLGWIWSWWYNEEDEKTSGRKIYPARNAPREGVDIKKLLDSRPNNVFIITQDEIRTRLAGLRKTPPQVREKVYQKPPILQEIEKRFVVELQT